MSTIDIDSLKHGLPTITPIFCQMISESAAFCLQYNDHDPASCVLNCSEDINERIELKWSKTDNRVLDTYGDLQEATEYGATGIAILLTVNHTQYSTVSRAFKQDGFDYWVGDKNESTSSFQRKARLEISGILKGNDAIFRQRIKQKIDQTKVSDSMNMDAYISIVDFANPKASLIKRGVNHES